MFARYYEIREPFHQRMLTEDDPVVVAMGRWERARIALRWAREEMGLMDQADHDRLERGEEDEDRWWERRQRRYDLLAKAAEEERRRIDSLFDAIDAHPDWIYEVPNHTIGTFYVRTVAEAVEGLEPFLAVGARGGRLRSPRSIARWRKSFLPQAKSMVVPILLGPRGMRVDLGG